MKTVFIVITRGFIVRNILRSGILELLKKKGYRIVVFFQSFGRPFPQYLIDEFEASEAEKEEEDE